jgi:hypothetical protein
MNYFLNLLVNAKNASFINYNESEPKSRGKSLYHPLFQYFRHINKIYVHPVLKTYEESSSSLSGKGSSEIGRSPQSSSPSIKPPPSTSASLPSSLKYSNRLNQFIGPRTIFVKQIELIYQPKYNL